MNICTALIFVRIKACVIKKHWHFVQHAINFEFRETIIGSRDRSSMSRIPNMSRKCGIDSHKTVPEKRTTFFREDISKNQSLPHFGCNKLTSGISVVLLLLEFHRISKFHRIS